MVLILQGINHQVTEQLVHTVRIPSAFGFAADFEIDSTAGIARAQLLEGINKKLC